MKVNSVRLYNNFARGLGLHSEKNKMQTSQTLAADKFTLSTDIISFKKNDISKIYINDLREIPDLPCGCCGKNMLQNSRVNDFFNRKIYFPASIALKEIKKENYYKEAKASKEMQDAYVYLKDYAAKSPKLTMTDILAKRNVKDYRKKQSIPTSEAFDEFRELTKLIAHNSKYMIEEITKLNPDFHKVEKRIFKELQRLAHTYPDETFYDILNKPDINRYYLKNLEQKQMMILQHVKEAAKDIDPKIKKTITKLTNRATQIFKDESPTILHKRGRVIAEFNNALNAHKDKPEIQKILEIINCLPDSKTDVDAFMIKGAQKNSNTIVEILINRQRNTFEHVKPHNRINDKGPNSIYNYIGLCGKCNGERQRTEYDIFLKSHPEMAENEQHQIDKIINYINKGLLTGYDEYPIEIKKALDIESKGGIKINIDNLDLNKAKANRKKRQDDYVAHKKAGSKLTKIYKFGKGVFYKQVTAPKNKVNND